MFLHNQILLFHSSPWKGCAKTFILRSPRRAPVETRSPSASAWSAAPRQRTPGKSPPRRGTRWAPRSPVAAKQSKVKKPFSSLVLQFRELTQLSGIGNAREGRERYCSETLFLFTDSLGCLNPTPAGRRGIPCPGPRPFCCTGTGAHRESGTKPAGAALIHGIVQAATSGPHPRAAGAAAVPRGAV